MQEMLERGQRVHNNLGDTSKIITVLNEGGTTIMTHKSELFPPFMTERRDLKMKEICSRCGNASKYKIKGVERYACSLPCYKMLVV